MGLVLVVLIGIVLGLIVVQDFRWRRISLSVLIVLFIISCIYYSVQNTPGRLPGRVIINSVFAGSLLVSGTLLVRFLRRNKSCKGLIGAGDFLFLISISPLLSFESYLVFLNTSMLLILFGYCFFILLKKKFTGLSIPFAGAMAICLLPVLIFRESYHIDIFSGFINFIYSAL